EPTGCSQCRSLRVQRIDVDLEQRVTVRNDAVDARESRIAELQAVDREATTQVRHCRRTGQAEVALQCAVFDAAERGELERAAERYAGRADREVQRQRLSVARAPGQDATAIDEAGAIDALDPEWLDRQDTIRERGPPSLGEAPGVRTHTEHERIDVQHRRRVAPDRKSTRLNSSHVKISYAVFC